ncbi:uncharacterized protein LOC143376525 [Andrena cerasifolii]|uniref:uncharacterized protein LOC143376525 n=1 Tax=Andrena cerasifolii TaxID=2819439 RepID=UPI0040381989
MRKMNMTIVAKDKNVNKIQIILNMLKKQIDEYAFNAENMKSMKKSMRNQRIEKLTMEAKRLSAQFEKIRKEIRRYEKKYEKALKRKVKHMKMQIQEDKLKLDVLRQRYNNLEPNMSFEPLTMKMKEAKRNLRNVENTLGIINKKIKIKIKKNEKLGRREMLFVNDDNAQQTVTGLVTRKEGPRTLNTRECSITLERLTEEQTRRYIGRKRLGYQPPKNMQIKKKKKKKKKQISVKSLKSVDDSRSTETTPNWHIKIPKSVLEESQKLDQNSKSSFSELRRTK